MTTGGQAEEEASASNDYGTETVFPGHKLTVSLVKQPDPEQPDKPYLAEFQPHRAARYQKRYATADEAEDAVHEAQSRAHVGFKESDRGMYD